MTEASALPPLVARYRDRVLAHDADTARQVLITQTGEMFRSPGARAMRFSATERFATDRIAFSWEARFSIARWLPLRVTDGYDRGYGALRVRVLGVPLQQQQGPDVDLAEAYRYLAELPWCPHAIGGNRELEWRAIGTRRIEVSTSVADKVAKVTLEFDDEGNIVRCLAAARPISVKGKSVPTPWGGNLSGHQSVDGIWMPTRGEVYWDLPESRFVYWRGEITSARTSSEPFR